MKNLYFHQPSGRMLTIFALLMVIVLLSSPKLTPKPTSISSPLQTVTPNTRQPSSLSKIDLEPILIMPGDLPSGFSGAQVRNSAPEMFKNVPKSDNVIYQRFQKGGETVGGVIVFLYESTKDIEKAYSVIVAGFGKAGNESGIKTEIKPLSEIGEKATLAMGEVNIEAVGFSSKSSDLVFVRCHAVVHIRFGGISDAADIAAYATRLCKRLGSQVCR
jgi:hypothetical protein